MFKPNFFKKENILAIVPTVVLLAVLFYAYQLTDAFINVRQIRSLLSQAQTSAWARDWAGTKSVLAGLEANLRELEGDLDRLYPFNRLPGLSSEYAAAKKVLAAGRLTIGSGQRAVDWLSQLPLSPDLNAKDKRVILAALAKSGPLWQDLKKDNDLTLAFLAAARRHTRLPLLAGQTAVLIDKLTTAQAVFKQAEPALPLLPGIAGYPQPKNYLLLLQNNTELRPTGGFIGTFGTMTLANAEIINFKTDNVYNLDEPAKAFNAKIPPEPIRKYVKQAQWFFRDVNWDPDFPTSARLAMQFYKDERGPVPHFDGVIAFTPNLIEDLLKIIGPIRVNEHTFTADNLVELLQYKVEVGFKKAGINIYNRKQIIDDAAQVIKDKILHLTPEQMRDLLPIISLAFQAKHLMVYFIDPTIQSLAANLNLDNRIQEAGGDYLYVVDANLGSLKTDPVVERQIAYRLTAAGQATASITYINHGQFDWKTTRYRTYTRLYVPLGSTFLNARGHESAIAIEDAHAKTVFGAFISIEPGASETLTFTYKLPVSLLERARGGQYYLLVQKQAGTAGHKLIIDVATPFVIDKITGDDRLKKTEKNQVTGGLDLKFDQEIELKSR